jgi:RNA polymerase sigma factor (sigma-70 family)
MCEAATSDRGEAPDHGARVPDNRQPPRVRRPYETGYALPVSMLELLARARADDARGDDRALDALLQRIYVPVRRALVRRLEGLPNRIDAARDVAQEVLAKVAEAMVACRAEGDRQVWSWVWTIVEHARQDFLRRELPRLAQVLFLDELEHAPRFEPQFDTLEADDEPARGAHAIALQHLAACLHMAPHETVQLIWHRVECAATYAELATMLGTTEAAAKRRWQRARETLRRSVLRRVNAIEDAGHREAILAMLNVHEDAA